MHNLEPVLKKKLGFWDKNGSPNLSQWTRPIYNQEEKKTYRVVDFAVPADHRVKFNESEKKDKYLYLARELKKTKNCESDGDTNCNRCSW